MLNIQNTVSSAQAVVANFPGWTRRLLHQGLVLLFLVFNKGVSQTTRFIAAVLLLCLQNIIILFLFSNSYFNIFNILISSL